MTHITNNRTLPPITITRHSGRARFRQIQDHLRELIAAGTLRPGTRLPPLRDWATRNGVAYETMCKAVRGLVAQGVLESAPRRGTTVARSGNGPHVAAEAIGIVTARPFGDLMTESRFFGELMPLVQDEVMLHQERVIHERWRGRRPFREIFDHLRLVDGIILLNHFGAGYPVDQIVNGERRGVPAVWVGGLITDPKVYAVRTDDVADCHDAVVSLAKMGHRRIATWAYEHDLRFQGYVRGLVDAGLEVELDYVFTDRKPQAIAKRWSRLPDPPTALLVTRNMDSVGDLVLALRGQGVEPGRDVYLCVYDDDLWNNLAPLRIPHARLEQPLAEIAHTAVRTLFDLVEGKTIADRDQYLRSKFVAVE